MIPQTIDVLPQNRLDEAALDRFLQTQLPEYGGKLQVRQFPGGFSNPTYSVDTVDRKGRPRAYVLRKRPGGALLPSAHRVDREFRVLSALWESGVPVPRARVLCEDQEVLGTSFFIMERVQGRLFADPTLPGCSREERKAIYDSMHEVLAKLHALDWCALGLADYGKPGDFLVRQIQLWTRQYRAAQTEAVPEMEALAQWLAANVPEQTRTTIIHGDFRLNNLLIHPTEPRVVAVLDWELSTIGDPLADLSYNCFCYYLHEPPVGFGGADPQTLGIPSMEETLDAYRRRSGASVSAWPFHVALQLFKSASILQGVYARALAGTAPAAGLAKGAEVRERARLALKIANQIPSLS